MRFKTNGAYLQEMQKKYIMDCHTVSKHKMINTCINAALATGVAVPYMLGTISLMNLGIIAGATYIAYDFISIGTDKVVFSLHSLIENAKFKKRRKEFMNASYDEQQQILKEMMDDKEQKNAIFQDLSEKTGATDNEIKDAYVEYEKALNELTQCLKYAKEKEDELKKEEEEIIEIIQSKDMKYLSNAEECIGRLKEREEICPPDLLDSYKDLVKHAEDIIEDARKNPFIMEKLNKTFNIYFRELISLLETFNIIKDNEEEQKKRYFVLEEIIAEFKNHLERLRNQMYKDGKFKFTINSSLLMESLRKENEDNVQE